ncbi:hypothetical protein F362_gp20 [Enterobacter phage EcP1]|uniref:dUTP diphosphatase n=1 Tax=Enterobacter phage EcP1 TaxID=942016 RepID=E9NIE5_9CAUD|nr:hypothetical protein F362_gp20 [Enterobacter phage EcP1]ADU79171.1 hypothetical protein EcP1_gp20 [Enterobacter phage EcP1]
MNEKKMLLAHILSSLVRTGSVPTQHDWNTAMKYVDDVFSGTEKEVKVLCLHTDPKKMFTKGTEKSAAFDLFAYMVAQEHTEVAEESVDGVTPLNIVIQPGEVVEVDTGIRIDMSGDSALAFIMAPRSGAGTKGLVLGNAIGLVDNDYTGILKLQMWNRTDEVIKYSWEKAVAQGFFIEVPKVKPVFVSSIDEFEKTERGSEGFGSTDNP